MSDCQSTSTDRRLGPLAKSVRAIAVVGLLALFGLLIAACGGGDSESTSEGGSTSSGQTLSLLTWDTYDEPEWLQEFEKETGIKVTATNVTSPAEMFAKVKANPSQYD